MEQHQTEIEKAGFQSLAIAQGKPAHADRYCGKLAPSTDCLVREDIDAYTIYGIGQASFSSMLSGDVLKAGFDALRRGNMQGKTIGDAKIMGGNFLVDTNGIIQYAHYSEHVGDHPTWETLLSEMKAMTD